MRTALSGRSYEKGAVQRTLKNSDTTKNLVATRQEISRRHKSTVTLMSITSIRKRFIYSECCLL
jgi:hypothetical protein